MRQIPALNLPSTTTAVGGKIHVRLTEGFFQNLRRLISGPLLLAYFLLVWIEVEGRPWLLFDFAARRIRLFGLELSWHDLPLLAGLMIAAAALLFFMAVGWGRVWCGFACPQSIWSWLFIRLEQLTEGRASRRARQELQPLRGARLLRRIGKHLLWWLAAFATALTFTGYFVPIRQLLGDIGQLQLDATSLGWLLTMTALTYLNAGLAREKVCVHMCPYARFQGVMFDTATRTVSYDQLRGEPRRTRRGEDKPGGDCVDCGLCVQVCPTGIDIRDGLQYECIDCAACIDACNAVMDKLQRPRGLIAFRSELQLQQRPSPLWRPRLAGYGLVLLLASGAVIWSFQQRTELLIEVRRERDELYRIGAAGEVCNRYRIKLEAFKPALTQVELQLQGPAGLALHGPTRLTLADAADWLGYRVCSDGTPLPARSRLAFVVSGPGFSAGKQSTFLMPPD